MAYRRKPGYERLVHFVRSSPTDQLQPKLEDTRWNDYFVRYLLGVEPPRWNALAAASETPSGFELSSIDDDVDAWLTPPASEIYPRILEWN